MLYGPEKAREIARSILPSTRRRSTRTDLAYLKRASRRRVRQTLHDWAGYDDPLEFEGHIWDYHSPNPHHDGYWGGLSAIVDDRRNGDKLGALLKWAPAVTAHLDDPEDRYMAIKAILPDNLIGRHALSHLINMEEFDCSNPYLYGYDRYNRRYHPEPDPWRDPEIIEARVRDLLAAGYHKDLNDRLSVPFAGLHDLERFVWAVRTHESEERRALAAIWEEIRRVPR